MDTARYCRKPLHICHPIIQRAWVRQLLHDLCRSEERSAVYVPSPGEFAWITVPAGLTPRGITELFNILDRDSGKYTFAVSCYMLELYQDDLADLLLPASQKQQGPQKVSITAVPACHTDNNNNNINSNSNNNKNNNININNNNVARYVRDGILKTPTNLNA